MRSIVFNNCHVDIRAERIFKAGYGAFWIYNGELFYNNEMDDNFKHGAHVEDPKACVEALFKEAKEYKIVCFCGRLRAVEVK